MKFASLKSGRDGRLVVVSRDLSCCAPVGGIKTLQAALEEGAEWILMHRERPLEHSGL